MDAAPRFRIVTAAYAIALSAGLLGIVAWVAAAAVAGSVPGWERADPEARFGHIGRLGLAGLAGFGMAGLSASFAGWGAVAALVAAAGGAVALAATSRRLGP